MNLNTRNCYWFEVPRVIYLENKMHSAAKFEPDNRKYIFELGFDSGNHWATARHIAVEKFK